MPTNRLTVRFRQLDPAARPPKVASQGDAGADLYALADGVVKARQHTMVGTGIAIELPEGTVGLVHPRSGLARKHGVTVLNAPGTIDSGYRGEVCVLLVNHSDVDFAYRAGDRIAQLVVQEYIEPVFEAADELALSARAAGGFGSTGA